MTKEKRILIDLGTVRVKESDKLNVEIECLETNYNPREKKRTSNWKFRGFSGSILDALKTIVTKELLIDQNSVDGLKTYLKAIEESNEKVLQAIQGMELTACETKQS